MKTKSGAKQYKIIYRRGNFPLYFLRVGNKMVRVAGLYPHLWASEKKLRKQKAEVVQVGTMYGIPVFSQRPTFWQRVARFFKEIFYADRG